MIVITKKRQSQDISSSSQPHESTYVELQLTLRKSKNYFCYFCEKNQAMLVVYGNINKKKPVFLFALCQLYLFCWLVEPGHWGQHCVCKLSLGNQRRKCKGMRCLHELRKVERKDEPCGGTAWTWPGLCVLLWNLIINVPREWTLFIDFSIYKTLGGRGKKQMPLCLIVVFFFLFLSRLKMT